MFDTFVMADWSAAASPGVADGQAGGIWIAVGIDDQPATVRPARTRHQAREVIGGLLHRYVAAGRRVLVGVDAGFGYPAGTARAFGVLEPGEAPWQAMWRHLSAVVIDGEDNANNRFDVAAELNARCGPGEGPFWGRAQSSDAADTLLATRPVYPVRVGASGRGDRLPELRAVEDRLRSAGHRPKSMWQVAYAGSVGGQTLTAIPHMEALRQDPVLSPHLRIWPFETGFDLPVGPGALVVLAEVYPSLLDVDRDAHPVLDAAQALALVAEARRMRDEGLLGRAFAAPADLTELVVERAETEEGWILPLGITRGASAVSSIAARPRSTATLPGSSADVGPGWDRDWPIPDRAIRQQLHTYLAAVLEAGALDAPTACTPWDGRALTAHLVATVQRFTRMLLQTRSGDPRPPFTPDALDRENHAAVERFVGQPERMLATEVEAFLGLLTRPDEPISHQRGVMPVGLVCRFLLGELLLHHLDLGTREHTAEPQADAVAVIEGYAMLDPDLRPTSDAWHALLAWSGR